MLLLLTACNTPPGAPSVAILPADPTTSDDLEVVIQGGASDDQGDEVTYTYAWFVDDAPRTDLSGTDVPAGETTKGEVWKVVVTPSDGKADGAYGEDTVVIANTPPTAAITLDPFAPGAGDGVTATATTDDADGDDVTIAWSWAKDGVNTGLSDATVPVGSLTRGEAWTVTATPDDGETAGEPATASFTVANTPPTLASVTLSPASPTVSDTVLATFDGADDVDGDAVTLEVIWYVDGVDVRHDTVAAEDTASLSGLFAKGAEIVVEAVPSDGYDDGAVTTSDVRVVADSAPSATGAHLSADPLYADSVVTCVMDGWSDADGDAEGATVTWLVDGVVTSTDTILPAGTFARGQSVSCSLVPDDGELQGTAVSAGAVTVSNSVPSCATASVVIGPDPATLRDTLSVVTDGYTGCTDADGDALVQVYDWEADGVSVGTGATFTASLATRGQAITLVTGWSDGIETGASSTSNAVSIVNAPPVVDGVTLSPATARAGDTVSAVVSASDADADAITLSYAWTVDGIAAGSGATLDGSAFSRGQTVSVTVTPSDGYDTGTTGTASLVVANSAPGAPTVAILPSAAGDDDALVCTVTAAAVDADGDALTYTFAWSVGGIAYGGTTTSTFPGDTVPASATVNGQTWTCSVTASDGTDTGTAGTDDAHIGCDADGDGYDASTCGGDDCDDALSTIHPGAAEICDAADTDEDCDGLADDADPSLTGTTYYPDADGDSFGDETAGVTACSRPAGYVSNGDDCDDTRATVKPGATEVCDSADRDEDCDGLADDADPSVTGRSTLYPDADGDGYGDEGGTSVTACSGYPGYVSTQTDCDDADATVSPAAAEVCDDGVDNDCDDASFPCGYEGRGYTSDAYATITHSGSGSFGDPFDAGDFDGDGQTDLVVSDQRNATVRVYYGPFAAGTVADTADDVTIAGPSADSFGSGLAAVGDVDGDGDDEFVILDTGYPTYRGYLLEGGTLADTTLAHADAFDTWPASTDSVARAGDFDDDGFDDFVVGGDYDVSTYTFSVHLYLGDVTGHLTEYRYTSDMSVGFLDAVGGEDLDGDGIDDVVIAGDSNYSYASVWFVDGGAPADTSLVSEPRWYAPPSSSFVAACLPGDVDEDGYPDLGVVDSGVGSFVFLGPPTTGLTSADAYATGIGATCSHGSDTNGDGHDELVSGSNRYDFPLASGALPTADGIVYSSTYTLYGLAPGDVTGDGTDDLVLGSYSSSGYGASVFIFTGGNL